jgi:hypothetical protein
MLVIIGGVLLLAWLIGLVAGYGRGGLVHDVLLLFGLLLLLLGLAKGYEAAKRRNRRMSE